MKPIIILPPKTVSESDIKELRDNGLCVVVAENPAAVKFLDPIPSAGERSKIESACIKLSRILLNEQWGFITQSSSIGKSEFAKLFVYCLSEGTELSPKGSKQEQEDQIYDSTRRQEIEKLARDDARAEHAAKKAAKKAAESKSPAMPQSPSK